LLFFPADFNIDNSISIGIYTNGIRYVQVWAMFECQYWCIADSYCWY